MLTRRNFLVTGGSVAAASVLAPGSITAALGAPRAKLFEKGNFPDGVASGDPTKHEITLWTRVGDVSGTGGVRLEVARDKDFRRVVVDRELTTDDKHDHTVKARIKGLDTHERYYYRFETGGAESMVGRFQTALPADSNETIRFAVISCQEFTIGYYNAHALIAREDLDFVINTGDYIYNDVEFAPPVGARRAGYPHSGGRFSAFTLDEYRAVYHVQHSDSDLQRVRSRFPLISTWSDHEVQNNYSGHDPTGGATTGDPYSVQRRDTAYRAFFEQLPTFAVKPGTTRLYHLARFGNTVDVFVLDERRWRDRNPCGDRPAPPCPELDDPRSFLGPTQQSFIRGGLQDSDAVWKVIANELLIMPIKLDDTRYDGFDAWQGFPVEREALLRTVDGVDNVVFVTGDYHAFVAGDVQTAAGKTVAAEFVGGSITAATEPETNALIRRPGWGTSFDDAHMPPEELARRKAANPWFDELDYEHHGYFICRASPDEFKTTFKKLQTIRQRSTALFGTRSWTIAEGQNSLTT